MNKIIYISIIYNIYLYLLYTLLFTYINILNIFINNNIWEELTLFTLANGFIPIKVYEDLSQPKNLKSELYRMGGVYGFINISNKNSIKQYIGSSKDLYQRFIDHYKGRNTNIKLKRSIEKYGIKNFNFVIYYWDTDPAIRLTDIETKVIQSFPFKDLYNLTKKANSMLGYKHTKKSITKMKLRFTDKTNHPMFSKTHNNFALNKISKSRDLNSIFNKKHTIETKQNISVKLRKTPLYLFNKDNLLIKTFSNQIKLADYLNLSKSTISRYLKSGKILLTKYYISVNEQNKKVK